MGPSTFTAPGSTRWSIALAVVDFTIPSAWCKSIKPKCGHRDVGNTRIYFFHGTDTPHPPKLGTSWPDGTGDLYNAPKCLGGSVGNEGRFSNMDIKETAQLQNHIE